MDNYHGDEEPAKPTSSPSKRAQDSLKQAANSLFESIHKLSKPAKAAQQKERAVNSPKKPSTFDWASFQSMDAEKPERRGQTETGLAFRRK